jgi:hypothetical protein
MTVLVTIETIALVLLSLLVAGLLRSHAEILRRLAPPEDRQGERSIDPTLLPEREVVRAADISGNTLGGEPVKLAVAGGGTSSLIAFLSSGCSTCGGFWDAFQRGAAESLPDRTRLIVVTRDSSHESPSKLQGLAPADVPVVMSSAAWDAYAVPLTPYFVYVDGSSGRIAGEGTAEVWPQVTSLLRDALLDAESARASTNGSAALARTNTDTDRRNGSGGTGRSSRIDDELRAAGIGADHPSLYGAGDPTAWLDPKEGSER